MGLLLSHWYAVNLLGGSVMGVATDFEVMIKTCSHGHAPVTLMSSLQCLYLDWVVEHLFSITVCITADAWDDVIKYVRNRRNLMKLRFFSPTPIYTINLLQDATKRVKLYFHVFSSKKMSSWLVKFIEDELYAVVYQCKTIGSPHIH